MKTKKNIAVMLFMTAILIIISIVPTYADGKNNYHDDDVVVITINIKNTYVDDVKESKPIHIEQETTEPETSPITVIDETTAESTEETIAPSNTKIGKISAWYTPVIAEHGEATVDHYGNVFLAKMGDDSNVPVYIFMCWLSISGIAYLIYHKRKK